MKKFSNFQTEAKKSLAGFHAKRLGLVGDGHGSWYGRKTGEFVAKTDDKNLKFYNQNQQINKKDPKQIKSFRDPNSVASDHRANSPYTEEYQKQLRERYISKKIFLEGDWIKSLLTEDIGKIIRRGTNYLICVTEDQKMFKSWIKDVIEVENCCINESKIFGQEIRNFINRYKAKAAK